MIQHTFIRERDDVAFMLGSHYISTYHNPAVGDLVLSLDYTIKEYRYLNWSHNYKENTQQELFDKMNSLENTIQENYLVDNFITGEKVYFHVQFDAKAVFSPFIARTELFSNGPLRAVVYNRCFMELRGKVYEYRIADRSDSTCQIQL